MFVRFRRRVDGKVRPEHIAALGSVGDPATVAERVAFWGQLHRRLDKLSNRIGADDQAKIIGAIHARIPMVTIDEQCALQRENAEADEKFWSGLQDMNAEQAEGHKDIAPSPSALPLMPRKARRKPLRKPPLPRNGSTVLRRAKTYRAGSASR